MTTLKKPNLSLVIPTMDRHGLLAQTLATITPQLSAEVELVVLDSSNDPKPVKELVEQAGGRYAWQKPSGFDHAYLNIVDLAQGEFIWLFGDDDLMKPHAVEAVLKILITCETSPTNSGEVVPLDFLVVNGDVIGNNTSQVLKKQSLNLPETEYGLNDRSKLVAQLGGLISAVGSVIIRKSFWSQGAAVAGNFIGKRFITMIIPLIRPARRVRYIPTVMTSTRFGHQSWMGSASVLIGVVLPKLIWSLPDIEDYAKQACAPMPPHWRSLILWRALGEPVGTLPYMRARLVGLIPVSTTKFLCRAVVRLLRKTNSMTGHILGF